MIGLDIAVQCNYLTGHVKSTGSRIQVCLEAQKNQDDHDDDGGKRCDVIHFHSCEPVARASVPIDLHVRTVKPHFHKTPENNKTQVEESCVASRQRLSDNRPAKMQPCDVTVPLPYLTPGPFQMFMSLLARKAPLS